MGATETMGRVTVEATIENMEALWAVKRGLMPADQARQVVVANALVDTGATHLSLPVSLIRQLGLAKTGIDEVHCSIGPAEVGTYDVVRLTVQGRDGRVPVLEVPDGVPVPLGRPSLAQLDFFGDLNARTLIGNPAHGGEHIIEAH